MAQNGSASETGELVETGQKFKKRAHRRRVNYRKKSEKPQRDVVSQAKSIVRQLKAVVRKLSEKKDRNVINEVCKLLGQSQPKQIPQRQVDAVIGILRRVEAARPAQNGIANKFVKAIQSYADSVRGLRFA